MRLVPPGHRRPHGVDLFTGRRSESEAFTNSLASLRRRLDEDDPVGVGRHNVLTFHGMGGIGKTALSRRLEEWTARGLTDGGWGLRPSTKVAATARIDLHASSGRLAVAEMLLELRAGVAPLRTRWPLFDLSLAAYWSAIHPGEPLPEPGRGYDLSRSVLETLGDVADLTGVAAGAGLGVRGARAVVDVARRRRALHRAVDAYEGFEAFLQRCADEPSRTDPRPDLACEIAGTLAWELSQISPCPLVVVFVDTTERLALDPRRTSEGHLNELVHQLPNVLFVLTGRDRVRWDDESCTSVPHGGRRTWPGLVPGAEEEPHQHLVGGLSPEDARSVVVRARSSLGLLMSDGVVDRLVTASRGLPQYLELACQVAVSIRDTGGGRQVRMSDVTGSLGALALRVLEDVPADEQRAVRAACLFRTFDVELVAAAAGVDHGCAARAVERPMIERHGTDGSTYRMHDAVREALRTADHRTGGGWSGRDWEAASTRAAHLVRSRHDGAKVQDDHRGVLDTVGLAITLACEQATALEPASTDAYADWLSQAMVHAPSLRALGARVPADSSTEYGRHVLDFITGSSTSVPVEERLLLLRGVFDSGHPLSLPAGRRIGAALRNLHRWEDALSVFDEVVALAPTAEDRRQRSQTLSQARRFEDAHTEAVDDRNVAFLARVSAYAHGSPATYFAEVEAKMARLREQGRQREHLEERGCHLVRRAFLRGGVGAQEVRGLSHEAEEAGHGVAIRDTLLTTVLCHETEPASRHVAVQRLKVLDQSAWTRGVIGFRYATAELCDALVAGDLGRLAVLRDEVARMRWRSRSWIPVECLLESVGLPVPQPPTQWLEPYEVVLARWTAHLHAHLRRRRSSRSEEVRAAPASP